MHKYHKIPNIFERDCTRGKNGVLLDGVYTSPELALLADCPVWRFTEKVDGMNIRVMWDGVRVSFGGRTDNAVLPTPVIDKLTEYFGGEDKEELFEQRFGDREVILFGECYGGRIQAVGPKYGALDFILFDVSWNGSYLPYDKTQEIAEYFGLRTVPVVGEGTLGQGIEYVRRAPRSLLSEDAPMEGVVAKPVVDLYGSGGARVLCKIKTRDFPPHYAGGAETETDEGSGSV